MPVLLATNVCVFPSPIGELHFSIIQSRHVSARHGRFRPLSGSYISQSCGCFLGTIPEFRFPSPIGELHFSIKDGSLHGLWRPPQFPSPIGELHFSISVRGCIVKVWQPFPSPIGELHFSIRPVRCMRLMKPCFRPLSGSYISQSVSGPH